MIKRRASLNSPQVYQTGEIVSVDAGLQIGYRISPRFTAGIGGLYRIGINKDFKYYMEGVGVYGGRLYADLAVYKGVFVHGEIVLMKRDSFPQQSITIVEAILKQRGIDSTQEPSNESDLPSGPKGLPMLVGILQILSFIILRKVTIQDPQNAIIINVIVLISIRVIISIWITSLATTYNLNKSIS